jgi:hypothetical protein
MNNFPRPLADEQDLNTAMPETTENGHPRFSQDETSVPDIPPLGSVNDTLPPQSSMQECLLDCTPLAGVSPAQEDLLKKLWQSIDTLAVLKRTLGGTEQDTGASDPEAQGATSPYGYQALRTDAVEHLAPLTPEAA